MNPISPPVPFPVTPPAPPVLDQDQWPNHDAFVTEDDTPVDSMFAEKQQRLLTEPLYSSWPGPGEGRPFLALSNVGLFFSVNQPPLVPDAMLGLDVRSADNLQEKKNRSYFVWVFGKPPDVVLEIVSNREGGEDTDKLKTYAEIGIPYYVIFDPEDHLRAGVLRAFARNGKKYHPVAHDWLPDLGLGLVLWQGAYERAEARWLRWCDRNGQPILTGAEKADRYAAQLRALGIEPQ